MISIGHDKEAFYGGIGKLFCCNDGSWIRGEICYTVSLLCIHISPHFLLNLVGA